MRDAESLTQKAFYSQTVPPWRILRHKEQKYMQKGRKERRPPHVVGYCQQADRQVRESIILLGGIYPGSRGPFSKYLIWNKPCLRLIRLPRRTSGQHKQATSFPCEKTVQNLNWVADWLFPRPQGINAVIVNMIGCIEKLHRMRLKTGCNCDVHNKQFNPVFTYQVLVWQSNLWLNFEII